MDLNAKILPLSDDGGLRDIHFSYPTATEADAGDCPHTAENTPKVSAAPKVNGEMIDVREFGYL